MKRSFRQLLLLVKKNFILQYRRPLGALVEILLPCIFLGLIALVRFATPVEKECFSYFPPFNTSTLYPKLLSFIAVGPYNNPDVENIADFMVKSQGYLPGFKVQKYTEAEIKKFLQDFNEGKLSPDQVYPRQLVLMPTTDVMDNVIKQAPEVFTAAIVMESTPNGTYEDFRYTLRFPVKDSFTTERMYPAYFQPGPYLEAGYNKGFVLLQQIVDRAILQQQQISTNDIPAMLIRQLPYPKWDQDGFSNAIRNSLPLMLVISFLWIGASISKELVGEKSSRMKETMKMMGLKNYLLWLSWIIMRLILMIVTVLLMTIVLKAAKYLASSNFFVIFIFLFEYAISVMCFCFFLSTLFSKTTTAIAGTMMGYFLLYVPYFFLGNEFDNLSNNQRYLSCLLSSTCMGYGANIISKWETMQEGLQFNNINKKTSDLDTFRMSDVLLMLFVDIIIYSLMTWYTEAVFPGEYGIKQKPWFFLTKTYWCGSEPEIIKDFNNAVEETDVDQAHEKGPKDKNVGISIKSLFKQFNGPKGKITAVNGLSLDMYQDQVTSLLGHNGAGKTTTMSMLTGLYSPNGGDAYVNGHSILHNMDRVRDSLGICPQHNVLFDRLTVKEHLEFFIQLKGYTGDIPAAAKEMIKMLKLTDKVNTKADELSGGMKRKLSVGIALAGGSKVVILDEPTAGMDPYARRATWDLILQNKKSRTILLTTHYMDEADFLGDRIAIMTSGKLVCSGSSLFLKKKYGVGYHLTLVKGSHCDARSVDDFIRSYVKTAMKISDVGSELVYVMPDEETSNFIPLFKKLEDKDFSEGVDIESFGLSLTTLEEVFIKVGESEEDENMAKIAELQKEKDANITNGVSNGAPQKFKVFKREELNKGFVLLTQQFYAMIIKRLINSIRYKKGLIAQIVLPVLFTVLGLLVVMVTPEDVEGVARTIDLANYPGKDVKGTGYLDDFTTKSFFTDDMKTYYKSKHLKELLSLKDTIATLKQEYSNASFSCCEESDLQLVQKCADKGAVFDEWKSCVSNNDWGYGGCYAQCMNNKIDIDGKKVDKRCLRSQVLPNDKYLSDDLSFWANAFLDIVEEEDDPRFYRMHQVAYTYSKLPSFIQLIDELKFDKDYKRDDSKDYEVVSFDTKDDQNILTGWFSHEGLHLSPGIQNVMSNMLLVKNSKAARITVTNQPLPKSLADRINMASVSVAGGNLAILMLMGFSFLTASFCLFIVEERENKSKHLQQISGIYEVVYWSGTFAWDLTNYFICIFIITIFFAIFRVDGFDTVKAIVAMFLVMLLYGYASIPFVYMLSLLFSSSVTAFSLIATFTFLTGLAGYITNLVLTALQEDYQSTVDTVLLILPNYNFIGGIASIFGNSFISNLFDQCLEFFPEVVCKQNITVVDMYALEENAVGRQLLACFVIGTVCFGIVVLNEVFGKTIRMIFDKWSRKASLGSLAQPKGEDDDVKRERTRVGCNIQEISDSEAVVLQNLRKEYGPKVAVQNLTLGIPKNECFGLLGVNGAGKTTTFSMLTGDISRTAGEAFVAGYNLQTDIRQIQRKIGYCPQFDALIGIMTGRELLTMFARMRGIPEKYIPETVSEAITNLNLDVHADKLCGSYSGGNKRKLSTAIALVGNPEVLFLDEPTAGMDPTARRFLWNVLSSLTASNIGTSIILTSHSMEECEALCNRLVIMVNGAFRCLGSIQHLKTKYGQGYTITMTMSEEKQEACVEFINANFTGANLKEEHTGYLHYELLADVKWSTIFELMEKHKTELEIEDYAVNQTSLEQVFLNFAKEQREEEPVRSSGWCSCCSRRKAPVDDIDQNDWRRGSRISQNRASLSGSRISQNRASVKGYDKV